MERATSPLEVPQTTNADNQSPDGQQADSGRRAVPHPNSTSTSGNTATTISSATSAQTAAATTPTIYRVGRIPTLIGTPVIRYLPLPLKELPDDWLNNIMTLSLPNASANSTAAGMPNSLQLSMVPTQLHNKEVTFLPDFHPLTPLSNLKYSH